MSLRDTIKQLVREVQSEMATTEARAFNEQGIVKSIDSDGTLTVQTTSGTYSGVLPGPKTRTQNEQVIIVTADGKKVAL